MNTRVTPQHQLVSTLLAGRKGLVVGIANEHSIAWGCARVFRELGAEMAVTWLNDKARPHVEPLATALDASIAMPLDVERPGQMEAVFQAIGEKWRRLDFALHSIAYAPAPDLVMGPVKSALESSVRYLAAELGARGIRVNAVSPGPIPTRAASGIPGFDALVADARERAPIGRDLTLDDVGTLSAFLVSDAAQSITGDTLYVDNGFHILS